jgi:hypothetical protein
VIVSVYLKNDFKDNDFEVGFAQAHQDKIAQFLIPLPSLTAFGSQGSINYF